MIELMMLALLISLIFLVVVIFGFIIKLWKSNSTFKEISSDSWFEFSGSILKRLLVISILGLLIYLIAFPIPVSFSELCARVLGKTKGFIYLVGLLLVSALITMFEFAACLGIIEGIVGSPNKEESPKRRNPENSGVSKRIVNAAPDKGSAVQEDVKPRQISDPVIVQEKQQYGDSTTENRKDNIFESKLIDIIADEVVKRERHYQRKVINDVKLDNPEIAQTEEQQGEDFKKKINDILYFNVRISSYKKKESEPVSFSDMDRMNGVQFEKFCVELLKYNGFRNVKMTRTTGDQGVDIIAEKDNDRYAIQCKHWKQNVGNSAVQEIHAGKLYYDCNVSAVMTNSHFAHNAKELAKKTQTILWDRENLHYFMDYAVRHPFKS